MALSNDELLQVENYLSSKGIHCDDAGTTVDTADRVLAINSSKAGKYYTILQLIEKAIITGDDKYQLLSNLVSAFQDTPDDTHYPSEKLVKDTIDDNVDTLNESIAKKADTTALTAHTSNTNNPHSVTKSQVGLGNCDNTSDANKPISSATQSALNGKLSNTGGTLTGQLVGTTVKVDSLYIKVNGSYVDISSYFVKKSGDTMTGELTAPSFNTKS